MWQYIASTHYVQRRKVGPHTQDLCTCTCIKGKELHTQCEGQVLTSLTWTLSLYKDR